ncbi:nicotinate-nicotinamide nucleotide adenylyltransferase, partial [Oleiphilus sp. HI0043]|uniref:nicotinate-nicotinamide nucleotide adenylyltransferase n=4 Tax=Oleiphilus TaxID=141450 RepID=UPI000B12A7C8
MKVVFGGTFDPVHVGHLRMATELVSELGVNSVDLMPCYQAVHKDSVSASADSRLEMLKLATAHDSCLNVDEREIRRG